MGGKSPGYGSLHAGKETRGVFKVEIGREEIAFVGNSKPTKTAGSLCAF